MFNDLINPNLIVAPVLNFNQGDPTEFWCFFKGLKINRKASKAQKFNQNYTFLGKIP